MPEKNAWIKSSELKERWQLNNEVSLAQYIYDHLSELPFRTISGGWLDEAWRRLGENAVHGPIEYTNELMKAVGGFDRGLRCRVLDKKYYAGLKQVITVLDILHNLDDLLWAASAINDFEKKHSIEAEDDLKTTTAKDRRAAVKAYLNEVLEKTGKRITRIDIWKRAGYRTATEFERWQRDDPKHRNNSANDNFIRVLSEKPHLK